MKKLFHILLIAVSSFFLSGCDPLIMGPSVNPNQFPTNAIVKADFVCDAGPMLGPSLMKIEKGTIFPVTTLDYYATDAMTAGTVFENKYTFPKSAVGVPFRIADNIIQQGTVTRMMIVYPNGELVTKEYYMCNTSKKSCHVTGEGCQIIEGGNFEIKNR